MITKYLFLFFIAITLSACSNEDFTEIKSDHAELIRLTKDKWIRWHDIDNEIVFFYDKLVDYRCGVDSVMWGYKPDNLDQNLQIGSPWKGYEEVNKDDYNKKLKLFSKNGNGCNPENPYDIGALKISEIIDLNKRSLSESIYIQINFAD